MLKFRLLLPLQLGVTFALVSCGQTDSKGTDITDSAEPISENSGGCGMAVGNFETSIDVDGQTRTFVLSLPNNYDPEEPYPLILAWHGLGGNGTLAKAYFGLQGVASDEAIIVYPDALPRDADNGQTGWDLDPLGYDFIFFDALYSHLTSSLCVETSQVFSTGHSYGGYMSNQIGCYRADVSSAIAPVAGGGPWANCSTQIPVLLIHGSNDDVVELAQGQASLDKWLSTNTCTEAFASAEVSPCVRFEGCEAEVQWCEHTGEHEWPPFAAEAIWGFFTNQ